MKRRSLMRKIGLSTSVLLFLLLGCSLAQAQKRGRSSKPTGPQAVASDWRYPELVGEKDLENPLDVGDGFKAEHISSGSVMVDIPGAYSDTLKVGGHGFDLLDKLAAAVFVKVMAAPTTDAEEALQKYYLGTKDVRQGNGEVAPEHSFRLSDGRTARIIVYYNARYGLLGIVRTGPATGKK